VVAERLASLREVQPAAAGQVVTLLRQ
jgi:hypothetical protein